ncbi:MAG TPA: iron-containing alcohol dehydrogenase, partial [Anaerolineaceae bacterium]|nr:iron-containing alcohol dehydrogenase [Anaerolineaceae bacterium]
MWFFNSPQVVYGEGALAFLETLAGQRACIISDANLVKLGMVERIRTALEPSGMDVQVFHD